MKIQNFEQFLKESTDNVNDKDFKVADIISTLNRSYETKRMFYTDLLQFKVEEERRDWDDIRLKAKLEKLITDEAYYKLVFFLDEKKYLLEINFDISYNGVNEKDAPETASPEELGRLNTVLEDIEIKKLSIKANNMDYSSSNVSDSIKKPCINFMIKMLSTDYDALGEKVASLEQK